MKLLLGDADAIGPETPLILCALENHTQAVNCVRWSPNGRYLASASDDKVIFVWEKQDGQLRVFGSDEKNQENWRCVSPLRRHAADILDMCWSPDGTKLASCSVDNYVIVWDMQTRTTITELTGHKGLVKGVSWDPLGKFLASASDDRTVRVVRTADWALEAEITEPFVSKASSSFFRRLGWSPDGSFLVTADAWNKSKPAAAVLKRNGWKTLVNFSGHKQAVVCGSFSTKIFRFPGSDGDSSKQHAVCAIGSLEGLVTIWSTADAKPIAVLRNMFEDSRSITDLSWGADGYTLACGSFDGSVNLLQFTTAELGEALSDQEFDAGLQKAYGDILSVPTAMQLAETPDQLDLESKAKAANGVPPAVPAGTFRSPSAPVQSSAAALPVPAAPVTSSSVTAPTKPGVAAAAAAPVPPQQQVTTLPDGRKRITPQAVSSAAPSAPAVAPQAVTVMPDGRKRITPQPLSGTRPEQASPVFPRPPPPVAASPLLAAASSPVPIAASTSVPSLAAISNGPVAPAAPSSAAPASPPRSSAPSASAATMSPASVSQPAISMPPPELSKDTSKAGEKRPAPAAAIIDQSPSKKPKSASKAKQTQQDKEDKKDKDKDKDKTPAADKKGTADKERKEKRTSKDKDDKDRRSKDKDADRSSAAAGSPSAKKDAAHSARHAAVPEPPRVAAAVAGDKLSRLIALPGLSQVSLEVANAQANVGGAVVPVANVSCTSSGRLQWEDRLRGRAVLLAGNAKLLAVGCDDGSLHLYSPAGRHLFPAIYLGEPLGFLQTDAAQHVAVIACSGALHIWNVSRSCSVLQTSLAPLLGRALTVRTSPWRLLPPTCNQLND
eukprot:TRINITY_DN6171_c0_g1_i2.p1 TRINITY_DN6171_c0_g1~~TRINITY_DN6171_c0_g1_i2.p1  ORF type:complete len:899 (+),score=310.92 TRINITY_DN6171_c0_g1_i2:188-2698(+)